METTHARIRKSLPLRYICSMEVPLISVKGGRRASGELRGNSTISTLLAQPLTVVAAREERQCDSN